MISKEQLREKFSNSLTMINKSDRVVFLQVDRFNNSTWTYESQTLRLEPNQTITRQIFVFNSTKALIKASYDDKNTMTSLSFNIRPEDHDRVVFKRGILYFNKGIRIFKGYWKYFLVDHEEFN